MHDSQGFVADQLSVERAVNCLLQLSNEFTSEERLEGIHMEIHMEFTGMQAINF